MGAQILLLALPSIVGSASAQTSAVPERVELRVEIAGVEGDVEDNVEARLKIMQLAADDTAAPPSTVRDLHDAAVHDIVRALQPFGYYRPEIKADLDTLSSPWLARYTIDPGPPITLTQVNVQVEGPGDNEPRFREAVETFPLSQGDVLKHSAYGAGKARLRSIAAELGYLDARFDTAQIRIDLDKYDSRILLHFQTGQRYRFGPVTFRQDVLDVEVLRNQLPFERGDPFDTEKLLELQTRLRDGPNFRSVEVQPLTNLTDGLEVPVDVDLEPNQPRRYEIGVGYGTNTGPRARAHTEFRRLNRNGHRATGDLTVSTVERSLTGRYIIPHSSPSRMQITFFSSYANLTPEPSSSDLLRAGTSVTRFRGGWRETFTLEYDFESFEVGVDTANSSLLTLGGTWSLTQLDDQTFPTRAFQAEIALRGGHDALLSTTTFGQLTLDGTAIRPLASRTRIIAQARLGVTATSDFRALPPSIRFFTGGDRSVRGYSYQSLGPRDRAGNVIGGDGLLTASLELEHLFLEHWGAAVFFDTGNAVDLLDVSLKHGAGAGLRWLAPIGMVRLDAAFALSRDGTPIRFHLIIGPDL
ncbi:MAG: outer membrane protein assembly factor [Gemmatimonadetes bacterium]|uniref:Translocation and assembly module subunit TamA n=1 Tax=Candidatus Kutchimonas denitrificans TaxID=3056748 RepID=A0AAE4ZD44_9BACT|nr:outer membrane protein assembly factor [Gemmatimonadota bacterium]NIR75880.1 outer membrane protein assembly factor [Candidatus Kutchimonas denitrificans]NIS00392.1 outer membrane protein assembly factor [Gemmatimonadota bacterium]NIT66056.1 outer membrane protein assembly factor [Gemmatimonadota bacterium]NIU54810.1 BamA/TamA family outer membrane protein [Gemmatimonadota bacterium]